VRNRKLGGEPGKGNSRPMSALDRNLDRGES
jgi:hypothetical protein